MKFHYRWARTVFCVVALSMSSLANAAPVSGQGTWETTLHGRDLDGNLATSEAWYDTALDITWLADANYAQTSGYDSDGLISSWFAAKTWAASLNPYGSGITGWRLPTVSPIDGTTADDATTAYNGTEDRGYNLSAPGTLYAGSTASEMAYLFYNTLGNKGRCTPTSVYPTCIDQSGWGLTNTGPFSNVGLYSYWSATAYAPSPGAYAWTFAFNPGAQLDGFMYGNNYAWAVHSGDVGASTVPVPAAVWLFGSGLLGLLGMVRRKARTA